MPYQLLGIIFFLSYFNLVDPLKCHSQHTNAYPLPEHKKTECVGEKCWILKNAQTKQVSRDCMWGFQFKIGCDLLEITKDNVTTQYFLCFCNNTNNCNSELPTFDTTKNVAKLGGKQIPLRKIGAEELKCYDFLDTQIYSNDGVMPFLKPNPSWPVAGMKPKTMQKASSCGLRVRELLKNETKTEVMMWDHTFELYNFAPSLHGDEWPMYDGLAITKQFSWDYRLTQQFCLTDRCNALTTSLASYENSVECLAIDGKRCRGQACFFGFYSKIDVVGFYSPMDGIHMYVCAEDLCNRDEAAALESVQTCYPNYPPLQKPGVETWADVEKALATGLYSFNCNGPTTDPTTTINLPSEIMTTTETPGVESGTSGPTEISMEYEDGKYTVWGWPIEPELFNFVPTLYGQLAPLYDGLVYAIQERCNQLTTNRGFYENGITCLVEGTKSCVGQACIFIVYEKLNKDERDVVAQSGCFSQDWTNSDAQYKIGMYMPSHNVRMYICAEDNCNQDEDTAKASIQNCEPKYPPVKGPGVETCHATDCNKDLPTFDAKKGLATMGGAQIPLRKLGAKQFRCFQFNNAVDYPQGGQPPFLKPQPMWDVNFTASPTLVKQSACGLEIEESYKEPEEKIIIGRNSDPELFNLVPSLYGQLIPTYDGLVYAVQFYWSVRYWQKFCLNDFCNQLTTNPAFYENGITCLVDETKQCVGQACIFILYEKIDKTEQDIIVISGCFSQDWTESVAQYKVGYYSPTKNIRMYICAEDNCNQDENRAMASIQNCQPYYPPAKGPGVETWYDVQKALATGEYSLNCKGSSTQNPIETTTKGAEDKCNLLASNAAMYDEKAVKCLLPTEGEDTTCMGQACYYIYYKTIMDGEDYPVSIHTDNCNEDMPTLDLKKKTATLFRVALPLINIESEGLNCTDFYISYADYPNNGLPLFSKPSINWQEQTFRDSIEKSSSCGVTGSEFSVNSTTSTVNIFSNTYEPFNLYPSLYGFHLPMSIMQRRGTAAYLRIGQWQKDNIEKKSTCTGDICWLFYDPVWGDFVRDCMTGYDNAAGCKRVVANGVPDSYICYCNHTNTCNSGFPEFSADNKTVKWAGAKLPNIDFTPKLVECLASLLDPVPMPRSMVSELDWPNLTTTAQTIPGLGCQLTVPIGLINATTVDVSISGREIRSERVRYLYLLNPGIWAPDQTFYQGMLYGYQISAAFIDLAMWCQQDECNIVKSLDFALSNAVTCRLQAFDFAPKDTCSGQACFYRFDKITGVLEMGCFWQDWTQAEGQLQVGFYSLFASAGFYICAEDLCNVDIATVNASIQNCKPKYPPYKGQGVETWADVETALSSGEYSFTCKTPPATTTIPTTIAQKAEESPTNSPRLETTTKSGHQKVFGLLSYLVLVMLFDPLSHTSNCNKDFPQFNDTSKTIVWAGKSLPNMDLPMQNYTCQHGAPPEVPLAITSISKTDWLNLSTLEATSMGMACSVEGAITLLNDTTVVVAPGGNPQEINDRLSYLFRLDPMLYYPDFPFYMGTLWGRSMLKTEIILRKYCTTDYCNNFNSIDALFHNVVTCQTQMFAVRDEPSPKSACLGDTCWLFYDPALQQYARDCLTGITRVPGCRRAIVNQKADSYLCYCNHSAKCNAEFPVFHENNQTVTWAEKSLPNTDVIPQMLTCGNEAFPELTIPINAAPTVDWLNVTTATITKEAPGCYINGDIKMPRDENFTVTFRTDYIAKSRQAYLFALDPTIWIADMPILFPGSLYATQFFPYIQDVQKFCREERCNSVSSIDALLVDEITCQMKVFGNVPPDTCKGQACIVRYDHPSSTHESGCFWQDWTTGEARIDIGFYSTMSNSGFYICAEDMEGRGNLVRCGRRFVNRELFPKLQAFRYFYDISTDWGDNNKNNLKRAISETLFTIGFRSGVIPGQRATYFYRLDPMFYVRDYVPFYTGALWATRSDGDSYLPIKYCTADHCNTVRSMGATVRNDVICEMQNEQNITPSICTGQACYFRYDPLRRIYEKGCYWQDWTTGEGQVAVGGNA
ncbi:unnamed protein product, partial [Mesorhabditis spiculigera]